MRIKIIVISLHYQIITIKIMKPIYFTKQQFNKELEQCLTILETHTDFYICEYISAGLYKRNVKIVIIN